MLSILNTMLRFPTNDPTRKNKKKHEEEGGRGRWKERLKRRIHCGGVERRGMHPERRKIHHRKTKNEKKPAD